MLTAKYINAYKAGYRFSICDINNNVYDTLAYWQKENFPDIEVTRPNIETNLELLHKNCLFTINGIIYDSIFINKKLYIKNATKNMLKSKTNSVGIISFTSLQNKFKKIKITPDMIVGETSFSLYEKSLITFEEDIYKPILILAGYIILEDPEVFYRVSTNTFALRLDRLNYMEKLYELYRYRNIFDELNIPISYHSPFTIDALIARQDSTIIKFLSHENSFLLNLQVSEFEALKIYLERSNIPSFFTTEIKPEYPLISGYGKILDYTYSQSPDKYKVNTQDNIYNNYILSKLPSNQIDIMNDHRLPEVTHRLAPTYFLKMSFSI